MVYELWDRQVTELADSLSHNGPQAQLLVDYVSYFSICVCTCCVSVSYIHVHALIVCRSKAAWPGQGVQQSPYPSNANWGSFYWKGSV